MLRLDAPNGKTSMAHETLKSPAVLEPDASSRLHFWLSTTQRQRPRRALMGAITLLAVLRYLLIFFVTTEAQEQNGSFEILPSYGETFQVHATEKTSPQQCVSLVMQHSFENSYERPFVGKVDPAHCPGNYETVLMELTVVAKGRQFDRLGFIFLDDIEVWRTSTLEPSVSGTYSVTRKDISKYRSIVDQSRTLIVDIGNVVNDIYTSPLNATLKIIYLYGKDKDSSHIDNNEVTERAADLILPLSRKLSAKGKHSSFSLPGVATTTVQFPKNVERAIVEIYASGNGDEEFWYTHVPDEYVDIIPGETLPGGGALREVQLTIDGQLAGFVWPFPVIYTGGLSPGLWRPIVAIDAFNQMTYDIDVTPFLGLLCDGKPHEISFDVLGTNEKIDYNWFVSGNVQLWQSSDKSETVGNSVEYSSSNGFGSGATESQKPDSSAGLTGLHTELTFSAGRYFELSSRIRVGETYKNVKWVQNMTFVNTQIFLNGDKTTTNVDQRISGTDESDLYSRAYVYPLQVNASVTSLPDDGFKINAQINHGKSDHKWSSSSPARWYKVDTTQWGDSVYSRDSGIGNATAYGHTSQEYSYAAHDHSQETLSFSAVNGTLTKAPSHGDNDGGNTAGPKLGLGPQADLVDLESFSVSTVWKMLGRGKSHGSD